MKLSKYEQAVREHYRHYWRKELGIECFDEVTIARAIRPLYVAEFVVPHDRLTMYASIGMSKAVLPFAPPLSDRRIEIYLAAYQSSEKLREIVAMIANYPFDQNRFIGVEDTIPLGDAILPASNISALILTPPEIEPPSFPLLKIANQAISILWMVPLTEPEREFTAKFGWHTLSQIFHEKRVPVADLYRDSAI